MKEIKDFDVCKASQENDVPTKIINEKVNISSGFIYQIFNNMTDVYIFPKSLKLANTTFLYKRVKKFKEKI